MTNQQIETLIQRAETELPSGSFSGARIAGAVSCVLTVFAFVSEAVVPDFVALAGWGVTYAMWSDGKSIARELKRNRALSIWKKLGQIGVFDPVLSPKMRGLLKEIARIYERDPRAEVLSLAQAVRLMLIWKQQQQRLDLVIRHLSELREMRSTLLEKQGQLHDLNDDNAQLKQTVAQLDADIGPLEGSYDSLWASCARLETILISVNAAVHRRQLHREVSELTAGFQPNVEGALALEGEHLDLERQLTREIEIFLQLERETDAHLREV